MARSASTAMRSWPDSVSSSARAEPNRPKPMTNTGESECLTNDRPFSWIMITGWPVSGSQTSGEADRPDTTDEHEGRQNPLTRLWGTGGEAIAQTYGAESRQCLKEGCLEVFAGYHSEGDYRCQN